MKAEWTNRDSLATSQTTKAILVVDKPESCTSCLLGIYHKGWFCLKTLKDIDITDRYHIPKWCPLKPMPSKKPVSYHDDLFGDVEKNFTNIGWNKCLEEIENG